MNRYLILATISVCFASTSLAHESDTITPTGFECKLEFEKGKLLGSGNCVEGDRIVHRAKGGWKIYDYCDLNSIKQTFQTLSNKGTLYINQTMCLYSPKIKKRNAES